MMLSDRHLTLEHFRVFIAVAECRSFAGAAQRLMRTQSALTHQIQGAENILGERLLVRTRGHFGGLTEEGMRFLPHARRVLSSVESAFRSIGHAALTGRVRVGVMDDFDIRWLIDLIARFEALHPGSEMSTVSDLSARLEERLARGEIDVAVIKRLFDPASSTGQGALRLQRLYWVVGADFQWTGEGRLPVVVFHEGCVYSKHMFEQFRRLNIEWRIAYAGHSYTNIRAAVAAGLGLAVLPEGQISSDHIICENRIGGVDLPDLGFVELVVRTAEDRPNPITMAFRLEIERRIGGARSRITLG